MKYYAAPMEGITGYIWRNAHHHYYPGIEKYYTPFLAPRKKRGCSRKEQRDIMPAHNEGIPLVPQVLTNSSEEMIRMTEILSNLSFREVNLNLGCPSGTVVSKGRGSGFLREPEALRRFFDEVFEEKEKRGIPADISVKTRLGFEDPGEILPLMEIYGQYPIAELTIHARVRKDMYKNPARKDSFSEALLVSRGPLCYNGDIYGVEDIKTFEKEFPTVSTVMLGRGLIANPQLHEMAREQNPKDMHRLAQFLEEIMAGYQEIMSGEKNVLYKMKELWSYIHLEFPGSEKTWKKIRKSGSLSEYQRLTRSWFEEQAAKGWAGDLNE